MIIKSRGKCAFRVAEAIREIRGFIALIGRVACFLLRHHDGFFGRALGWGSRP
jgi:hypothetical protein